MNRYFSFNESVNAQLHKVEVLKCSYRWPNSKTEVEESEEAFEISLGAKPSENVFGVFIRWFISSSSDARDKPVEVRVLVEFRVERFDTLFNLSDDGTVITPLHPDIDTQLFMIAYSTMRGVVATLLSGNPWKSRIPVLVSTEEVTAALVKSKTRNTQSSDDPKPRVVKKRGAKKRT